MLRSFFIYLSKASWAQRLVTGWGVAWRAASRFIAGTTVEEALKVIRDLNGRGINVTLDHLGEHTSSAAEAADATLAITRTLDAIEKAGLCANVSIKLSQIGLALDERVCRQNLERILARAKELGNFVRVDMEDTPYTDQTIGLCQQMRKKGYKNVGIALQSYLYRSEADARNLLEDRTPIRLVKGAYQEPASKAFPRKADVDANFDLLTKLMMDAAATAPKSRARARDGCLPPIPAIGTHDQKRIEFAKQYAARIKLPKGAYEFQMLYGIRRDLQENLRAEGYGVRVYVPFGTHWYPYFMRRLAERPANIWFFVSNFFRK
ncbi:MAG TPA: proline dehydrogenase family protein [Anaerolineales bacterium]|nr:proline dehydrogenase family protein [Anaerolineales bacterium]